MDAFFPSARRRLAPPPLSRRSPPARASAALLPLAACPLPSVTLSFSYSFSCSFLDLLVVLTSLPLFHADSFLRFFLSIGHFLLRSLCPLLACLGFLSPCVGFPFPPFSLVPSLSPCRLFPRSVCPYFIGLSPSLLALSPCLPCSLASLPPSASFSLSVSHVPPVPPPPFSFLFPMDSQLPLLMTPGDPTLPPQGSEGMALGVCPQHPGEPCGAYPRNGVTFPFAAPFSKHTPISLLTALPHKPFPQTPPTARPAQLVPLVPHQQPLPAQSCPPSSGSTPHT